MKVDLQDGQVQGGFVADNSWNYYTYTPQSVTAMLVSVVQNKSNEDCDIYVRRNERPSQLHWDARNVSLGTTSTIRIDDAQFDTWHIGVFGFRLCEYQITVKSTTRCPLCGPHGTCDTKMGVCICQPGWSGTYCESGITPLNGSAVSGSLAQGEWAYYSIESIAGSLFTAHLYEDDTEGYFWLFVYEKQPPTLIDNNPKLADRESNTDHHTVTFTAKTSQTYYIGVFGSPFGMGDASQKFPFELQAWISPF